MKQFKPYPIYINDGTYWKENVLESQAAYFLKKGDTKMVEWLDNTGKRLYEIMPSAARRENLSGYERVLSDKAHLYENTVERHLVTIAGTRVGKELFKSLDQNKKYWIVPLDGNDRHLCNSQHSADGYECGAFEFPGKPKEGGGHRVYYNPTDFPANADEILFHEMIHSYRDGRFGFDDMKWSSMTDYITAEEFVALHLQNIYREGRGEKRFYATYRDLANRKLSSKQDAYYRFSNDSDALMALKYFVQHDPFVNAVSKWKHLLFNPWYDQPVLERIWLGKAAVPGLKQLPAF